MENDKENPDDLQDKQEQAEKERQHKRMLWRRRLETSFSKSLQKATEQFTWQEKADFLEAMIQFVPLLQNGDASAKDFFTEKILKVFRNKLEAAYKVKLFQYLYKELLGVDIIVPEVFKDIEPKERLLTEDERQEVLKTVLHLLNMDFEYHYTYVKPKEEEKSEKEQDALDGIPGLKGRIKRSAEDHLTKLNQEQTALFIEYLKKGRIILKDEYLNDKQAGLGFHILTGYSPDSLRIKLSEKEISKIKTKANLKELHNALINITNLISNDLK